MIYVCFFIYLYFTSILSWFCSKKNANLLFLTSAFFLIAIICLRNIDVGTDTIHYAGFFACKNSGYYGIATDNITNSTMEPGIYIYARILRLFFFNSSNPNLYIFTTGFLTILPLLYFINKYSSNKCFSLFIIFIVMQGGIMVIYAAALRQAISISIMLIAIHYLIQKKNNYLKYYIIISIIACSFHYSSIITSIVCYIVNCFHIRTKIPLYILLLTTLLIVFCIPNLGSELLFKSLSLLDSNLENLRYAYYMNDKSFESSTRSILSAGLNLSLPFMFLFFNNKNRNIDTLFTKLFILTPCIFLLFGSFEQINRLAGCYWIIAMIGLNTKRIKNKTFYVFITLISFFFLLRACQIYLSINNQSGIVPYSFIWE